MISLFHDSAVQAWQNTENCYKIYSNKTIVHGNKNSSRLQLSIHGQTLTERTKPEPSFQL